MCNFALAAQFVLTFNLVKSPALLKVDKNALVKIKPFSVQPILELPK